MNAGTVDYECDKVNLKVSSLDTLFSPLKPLSSSFTFSFAGLAEAARGRGNSRANLPSFRLTATNAALLLLITMFISRGINEVTLLSAHLPLITS